MLLKEPSLVSHTVPEVTIVETLTDTIITLPFHKNFMSTQKTLNATLTAKLTSSLVSSGGNFNAFLMYPGVLEFPSPPSTPTQTLERGSSLRPKDRVLHHYRRDSASRKDQTYTKRHRDRLLQGSLENVSCNPLGEIKLQESSLRRSRSLAISREDVFTNLEIPNASRNRRSQLIPRAKLIDKYYSKDRSLQRGVSQESIYVSDRSLLRRKSSDYAVPQQANGHKHQVINHQDDHHSFSNFQQPSGEIDSLDSNYHNRTSLNTVFGVSHENLSYPDGGLSLPNYYPDSKCDTDLSFTDNVSLSETNLLSDQVGFENNRNNKLRQSHKENISYDENIVFGKNALYDKVAENNYYTKSKPRTIRGSTPYARESDNYYSGKPRSLPNYASNRDYDSDSTLSDYDPKYYEPVEKDVSDEFNGSTFEEIELNNENISKAINKDNEKENVYGSKSDFSNIEANPIYDEIPLVNEISVIEDNNNNNLEQPDLCKTPIKTSIQVLGIEEAEEYKTVVNVTDEKTTSEESEEGSPKEAKKHSHNYLKEFLETQKGSKKPLQNFLSKRISRAFTGDKNAKQSVTGKKVGNLVENQYFSLPDITISKNLQKCDKIDRKLRKCESKAPEQSTNRFIVNIGNHFDVTAHSSIPVDFELKISKIPKAQKSRKSKTSQDDRERNFLDAVRSLKDTLGSGEDRKGSKKINKIIVNGEEINTEDLYQRDKEVEVIVEDTNFEMNGDKELSKEYQEKIHNMRNYWGNIVNDNKEKTDPVKDECDGKDKKCKIVGMHTKVEEVKKKFEPPEEKPPEKPGIVQINKQIFEKVEEKPRSRTLLENPFFEREQFESLNPNIVEIEEREDLKPKKQPNTRNSHKPLGRQVVENNKTLVDCGHAPAHNGVSKSKNVLSKGELGKLSEFSRAQKNNEVLKSKNSMYKSDLDQMQFINLSESSSNRTKKTNGVIKSKNALCKSELNQTQFGKSSNSNFTCTQKNNEALKSKKSLSKSELDQVQGFKNASNNDTNVTKFGCDHGSSNGTKNALMDKANKFNNTAIDFNSTTKNESNDEIKCNNYSVDSDATGNRKVIKKSASLLPDFTQNHMHKVIKKSASLLPGFTQNHAHKPIGKSKNVMSEPEFDHVRYRVMKSDLFQKKIFANCEKESQFDGLMQYLQDYSFQELLIDNNIVIIEPIRTNVQYVGGNKTKTARNVTQFIHKPGGKTVEGNGLKRHFFYHPIRVNREVNDDELPNPDTVNKVRQMFEGALPRSQSSKDLETITKQTVQYRTVDPDKDRCSATDSNSSVLSDFGSNENFFESLENEICCDQFVSEDILEKIRQCGTSVTYYGGRVVNKKTGKAVTMTKAIMDEIQNQKCKCRRNSSGTKTVTFVDNGGKNDNEASYQGVKFKLLKSNSCSSRLELVGTKNLAEYRNKFITKQKQLIQEHNLKKQNDAKSLAKDKITDKNVINETIKESGKSPKIIAEEMKSNRRLVQWGEAREDNTSSITYTKAPQKITYDYHNFDKVKPRAKKLDEMEFEPYEVAN